MNEGFAGFLVGFLCMFGLSVCVGSCLMDAPAVRLRFDHCQSICAVDKMQVHSNTPSMCVCMNGKTYRGKAPEFYKVTP